MSVECWQELQEIQPLRALYRENLGSLGALAVQRERGPKSTAVDPMIQSAMILNLNYEGDHIVLGLSKDRQSISKGS